MATQFDIIRNQAEAARRSALNRAQADLRRDTSLVSQASRWAGRTMTAGEAAVRRRSRGARWGAMPPGGAVKSSGPVGPAPDGYVRRSPVQPLHVAEGYRKRQVLRAVTAAVVIAAACMGIYFLNQLGLFGR